MEKKFIKILNYRFRINDISSYHCIDNSSYVGNFPIIVIWRKKVNDPISIHFSEKPESREKYDKSKNELDEIFLGKTENQSKLLP